MLIDFPKEEQRGVLVDLAKSPQHFHFTGSRFLGCHKSEEADYDFFTSDADLDLNWLMEELGFCEVDHKPYGGGKDSERWYHNCNGLKVDLFMLRGTDFNDYLSANYMMKQLPHAHLLTRKLRIDLYNFFFQQNIKKRNLSRRRAEPRGRRLSDQEFLREIQGIPTDRDMLIAYGAESEQIDDYLFETLS